MYRLALSIFLGLIVSPGLMAQEPANPEEGFELMRQLATAGDYGPARQLGYQLLAENNDYHDVALYLARVHGWESQFDSAYLLVDRVISMEPELYEAYKTCVDLAFWENNNVRLNDCATKALSLKPGSEEIIDKLTKAQQNTESGLEHPEVFVHYTYDHFTIPYVRNWHMISAGGQIPLGPVLLIPCINGGFHPGTARPATDIQFNLDGYLTLGRKNYALLGYGYSPDGNLNYLPVHRAVAEIWQVLPRGFGLSAGMRYFYWEDHFTFLSVSVEKYAGSYWFSLRNYLFFKDLGVSSSHYLTARRYFESKFHYLGLTLGYGTAPDEPLLVVTDLDRLNAASCRIQYSRQLSALLRISAMAGYGYEEYADQSYRNRFDLKLGTFIRLRQ